jgi:hypothetical protein
LSKESFGFNLLLKAANLGVLAAASKPRGARQKIMLADGKLQVDIQHQSLTYSWSLTRVAAYV